MEIVSLALAALVGLSLGLLGGGGSILTVPIFVYVMGIGTKTAIAMSLPVVGATSLAGAISHWRAGNVKIRVALVFGSVAMIAAYAAARLSVHVSGAVQLTLLAVAMLAAAASMLRRGPSTSSVANTDVNVVARQISMGSVTGAAIGVGLLTGLVGIGGGFLAVPALVASGKLPMREAIGTSLVVIALNSLAGFAGYAGQVDIDWPFVALFSAVAIAGILAGTYLVNFVRQTVLKQAFAALLVLMGGGMLYRNYAAVRADEVSPIQIKGTR